MAYAITFSSAAQRQLARFDRSIARRIAAAVAALADAPRPSGCKKLQGVDAWRIRVGDYRIIYQINDRQLLILIVRVGHRREVYD